MGRESSVAESFSTTSCTGALRLARDLRIRIVGPLDGMTVRELLGAHVAVVVGS